MEDVRPAAELNVAVTAASAFMVTLHTPVPVHAPDQPANVEPVAGKAVSVTAVPGVKSARHVDPQLIPAGLLVMVPEPEPLLVTVNCGLFLLNMAVTEASALRVMVHVLVPVQAPDQPANVEPVAGAAVRVTAAPLVKAALHVDPQLIPAGLLVMVPEPEPLLVTVNCGFTGGGGLFLLNVAVTDASALSVRLHAPVPLHAPDQPAKLEPVLGAAFSVTAVPPANVALHVDPQLIPAGLLVTVPVAEPPLETVS